MIDTLRLRERLRHPGAAVAQADLLLFLADGRIVDQMARPTAESVLERLKRFDVVPAGAPDGEGAPGAG